jgi:hypothetical protein
MLNILYNTIKGVIGSFMGGFFVYLMLRDKTLINSNLYLLKPIIFIGMAIGGVIGYHLK